MSQCVPTLIKGPKVLTTSVALQIRDGYSSYFNHHGSEIINRAKWHLCGTNRIQSLLPSLARTVKSWEITVWNAPLFNAAIEGSEVFTGTNYDRTEWPSHPQLWLIDTGNGSPMVSDDERDLLQIPTPCTFQAIFFHPVRHATREEDGTVKLGERGLTMGRIFMPLDEANVFPYIRLWEGIRDGDKCRGHWASVFAAMEFLKLPFITKIPLRTERPERRRLERVYHCVPEVNTVVLRRQHSLQPAPTLPNGETPASSNWSCQWMVRGHWRQQFYPSLGECKPKYIEPYIKGPESKPLRAPKESVFFAKR